MRERPLHDPSRATAAARTAQADFHKQTVDEVKHAIAMHEVVVIGMGWNPHVARVRKALDEAGVPHHDLDIGNYLTGWKERLAVKLWAGWPTFPMVFVRTVLVGGATDTVRALRDGELQSLRDGERG